jgi:hypothetical protein
MDEFSHETAMDYLSRFKKLGRREFLGLHPYPVLLEGEHVPATRRKVFMLKTITNEIRGLAARDDLEMRLDDEVLNARVIPVGKREADSPGHMIFLGRSPTNDVVISDTMVSKLHAYFCQLPGENEYQLVDMNSTNGTFVNGEKLLPSVKKTLCDADEVAFGPEAKLIFFSPPGFCELLAELVCGQGR